MKLFDIERNSFVDGPGIRTTVFFKGCNMKCMWCHNPESQSFDKDILFYGDKCVNCRTCIEGCPVSAISDIGIFDKNKCIDCGNCELFCPASAIKHCGREYTPSEVLEYIKRDKIFYDSSDGGVTFSGGECMLQTEELCEILKLCNIENIHTAVDTAGNVKWEYFKKILPYTDMFLYDIKLLNNDKHKRYTGSGNELILENLIKLLEIEKRVWVRIPVIKGINDTLDDMYEIKEFLKPYKVEKIEILPYHRLGEGKYKALGLGEIKFDAPDNVGELKKVFAEGECNEQ